MGYLLIVIVGCPSPAQTPPHAALSALDKGKDAMLERHYRQAVALFEDGLKQNPDDLELRLELGRAYLSMGSDGKAIQQFRRILTVQPDHRLAKLEYARALSYRRDYDPSNGIYRELLAANPEDEAAAIGLASNLLHQRRSGEARGIVEAALLSHPNSLRLQEYKDRIASGSMGGEEREVVVSRNSVEGTADYVNDSAGNHAWRAQERVDFRMRPNLIGRVNFEQQFLHSRDDAFEAVETYSEEMRWRPRENIMLSAGGGAIRFNKDNAHPVAVHAIYDVGAAWQAREHFVLGAGFSRVPITPDAEAAEHRLTAQGWEVFGSWTPSGWQVNVRASEQHYSDENVGNRQTAEVIRSWKLRRFTFDAGYRYRRYSFAHPEFEHGYFNPDTYQSHLAMATIGGRVGKRYRGSFTVRSGAESPAEDTPFGLAWEIHGQNEVFLGNWTLELDYSHYNLVQDTGAFKADAGRFALTYHF